MHRPGASSSIPRPAWARLPLMLLGGVGLVLAMPAMTWAHGRIPGAGDVISGALHPLLTPVDVLLIVALSLCLAQPSPRRLLPSMVGFVLFSGLALGLADVIGLFGIPTLIPLVLAMGIATLVIFAIALPLWARVALSVAAAIALGLNSAPEVESTRAMWKMSLGTWIVLGALVCDLAFYASLAQKHWLEIGRRILASWIIAIALMMLAFTLAPPSP